MLREWVCLLVRLMVSCSIICGFWLLWLFGDSFTINIDRLMGGLELVWTGVWIGLFTWVCLWLPISCVLDWLG